MPTQFFRLVPFAYSGTSDSDIALPLDIEITGTVSLANDTLDVIYLIAGTTERIKFASASPRPSRKDELWRTTCFELFMKLPMATEYWEFNLAPSHDWNAYRFTNYRSALQQEAHVADTKIATELTNQNFTRLQATLPLPSRVLGQPLAIGISSVIEDREGNLHYFSLRHAGTKPDFHDPAGFDIKIDPTSA